MSRINKNTKKKSQKLKEEKRKEQSSVHKMIKSCYSSTSVILRNKLEAQYPNIWLNTGNAVRSDERRIKRMLDNLVDFGIVARKKVGKDQIYTYLHDEKSGKIHKIANELNISMDDMSSYYKRRNSIVSLLNDVSDNYYIQTEQENVSNKEKLIRDIEIAIDERQNISITYKGKQYKNSPLKIVQFDGFWYLISYNIKYYKYRIKDISEVKMTQESYDKSILDDLKLDEWQNIWHTPNIQASKVIILIHNDIFHYFTEKNILGVNTHKNRLTPCRDGIEYELYITHEWELLPTLMQWQKHVSIVEQAGDIDIIGSYKKILHNIKI